MSFHQSTRDACRSAALLWGNDDAEAVVAAAPHGSAPGVHHEADQETAGGEERRGLDRGRRNRTETSGDEWLCFIVKRLYLN